VWVRPHVGVWALVSAVSCGGIASAQRGSTPSVVGGQTCYQRLDALEVPYAVADALPGIELPVRVKGPVGGVTYRTWRDRDLVLDCSLVLSLARAGRFLVQAGITEVFYSSAYQRRNVRGTRRPSRHSFGLAIDLHQFSGQVPGMLSVEDHFEQGLGDDVDCIGQALTPEGGLLRTLYCQFQRSLLFRLILTPDYDQDHYNHFHVEALPYDKREELRDGD
jgi:hypothetical protein